MRNRFNLNEEDKKHIRGLHGIQQPINEQEVLKKIAELCHSKEGGSEVYRWEI